MMKKLLLILMIIYTLSPDLLSQEVKDSSDIIVLKGTIIDSQGEPLVGVLVFSEDESSGVITDINGSFSLKVKKGAKIQINYTGFKSFSFDATEIGNIKINLEDNLILFCCNNHSPAHCTESLDEMEEYTKKYDCSFK